MEENKKMTDLPFQIEGSLKKLFIGADEIKNKDYDSIEFLVDKLIPQGTLCALVGKVTQERVRFSGSLHSL